ncbi:integrase core domain-containing protein [Streptomyces sp. NPDC001978]|uniref:integrase core domain-containing protein n=1 Tax=Streptomyces sp. NPDC001978 TaxID=3364627 RepID=UPI0036BDA59C
MITSLRYRATRALLSVPAVLLRRETAKDAELPVLRHENAVLRRQLTSPIRYEPADRFWLAALSSLIPRRRWSSVFPVTPGVPQAPRMNAHCERVTGTIRREALDHVLIMNEAHARQALAEYQHHYNRQRPHRARDQRPPEPQDQPAVGHAPHTQRLLRTRVLGGVINEYRYAA